MLLLVLSNHGQSVFYDEEFTRFFNEICVRMTCAALIQANCFVN